MTQKFLEEICIYFANKSGINYKSPIALDAYTHTKKGLIIIYFYKNDDDIYFDTFYIDEPFFIKGIYKHNIIDIESYVSNTIEAKELTIINGFDNKIYDAIVYAIVGDKFLFRLYDTDEFYLRGNIHIDYTIQNLNLIDEL